MWAHYPLFQRWASPLPQLDSTSVLVLDLDCRLVLVFSFCCCSLRVMTCPAFVLHRRYPQKLQKYIRLRRYNLLVRYTSSLVPRNEYSYCCCAAEENVCVWRGWQECCCTAVAINESYFAGAAPLYYRYAGVINFSAVLLYRSAVVRRGWQEYCCTAVYIYRVVGHDIRSTSTTFLRNGVVSYDTWMYELSSKMFHEQAT